MYSSFSGDVPHLDRGDQMDVGGPPPEVTLDGDPADPVEEPESEETVVIAAHDDREEEGPPGIDGPLEEMADSQGTNPGAPGDQEPPTDTPSGEVTGEEGPDRAGALQRLLGFTAISRGVIQEATSQTAPSDSKGAFSFFMEEGFGEDEAKGAASLAVRMKAVKREEDFLGLQYSAEVEATGLKLHVPVNPGDVTLRIAEPDTFATTLQAVPLPEGSREHFDTQITMAIDEALRDASAAHIITDRSAAGVLLGEEPDNENTPGFDDLPLPKLTIYDMPETLQRVQSHLPGCADAIASELERLGIAEPTVEAVRELAIAHREGLVPEWAVGLDTRLLGTDTRLSVLYRFPDAENWDGVNSFVRYLRHTAPDSELLQAVYANMTRSIRAALAGEDPLLFTPAEAGKLTPETIAERRMAVERIAPVLRTALDKINEIMRDE